MYYVVQLWMIEEGNPLLCVYLCEYWIEWVICEIMSAHFPSFVWICHQIDDKQSTVVAVTGCLWLTAHLAHDDLVVLNTEKSINSTSSSTLIKILSSYLTKRMLHMTTVEEGMRRIIFNVFKLFHNNELQQPQSPFRPTLLLRN